MLLILSCDGLILIVDQFNEGTWVAERFNKVKKIYNNDEKKIDLLMAFLKKKKTLKHQGLGSIFFIYL